MPTISKPNSDSMPARRTLVAVAVSCSLMGAALALAFDHVQARPHEEGHPASTALSPRADLLAQRSLKAGWRELAAEAAEQPPFARDRTGASDRPVPPVPSASTLVSSTPPQVARDWAPLALGAASAASDAPEVPAPPVAPALAVAQPPDGPPAPPPAWTPSTPASEPGAVCGKTTCRPGQVCCNASCGTCVDPGERCDQFVCGMNASTQSEACGPNTCNTGQVCCNVSCGTCAPPGVNCDQRQCDDAIQIPSSPLCGLATCNVGTVCCNPSCGICAPFGVPCSQRPCG
ncbi:MAG: hypothetical protein WDO69_11050 [Pseudomonadota bacterium]